MKVAVATNNGETVSQHFGHVRHFLVLTVEDGEVTGSDLRDNPSMGIGADGRRARIGNCHDAIAVLDDCEALVAGGMGRSAYERFGAAGIRPVLSDARRANEAAIRYAAGELPDLGDRLHAGGERSGRR